MMRWNTFGQREAWTVSVKHSLLHKFTWTKPRGQDGIQLSVLKELKYEIAELPMQSLHQPPPQGAKVSNAIGSCMNNRINKATFPLLWRQIYRRSAPRAYAGISAVHHLCMWHVKASEYWQSLQMIQNYS